MSVFKKQIFSPGQLIRAKGVDPAECYLILSHRKGESLPYKGSQGRRAPGSYQAISPIGTIVSIPDDSYIWEVLS